jgi:hypothetical protein
MTNSAQRAYLRRFIPTMFAYVVAMIAVREIMTSAHPPTGALAYALAAVPALPVLGVFWLIGRYLIEEQDEYVRLLLVRQILIATGLTLSLTTLWGFLEILADAPHIPLFYVTVLWMAGLAVGACWNRLRA